MKVLSNTETAVVVEYTTKKDIIWVGVSKDYCFVSRIYGDTMDSFDRLFINISDEAMDILHTLIHGYDRADGVDYYKDYESKEIAGVITRLIKQYKL